MGDLIEVDFKPKDKSPAYTTRGAVVLTVDWLLVFEALMCRLRGKKLRIIATYNIFHVPLEEIER